MGPDLSAPGGQEDLLVATAPIHLDVALHMGTVHECGDPFGPLVTGDVSVKCVEKGTLYVIHFRNLVPKGLYTMWNFLFDVDGFAGGGPLGAADGSQDLFSASAAGEGQLSILVPSGTPMAFPEGAQTPDCALTDLEAFVLIAAYHFDGQTHGSGPGPASTQAFHAVSTFVAD